MLDDILLEDPGRLAIADDEAGGCLLATACAGAQVRATVEAAAHTDVAELSGNRPRALVLLTRPGPGLAVARLLVALLTPACPVPIVLANAVPGWIGPLDIVLAHGEDPTDVLLAESVDLARRRGARVVVTAPPDGPVAAAAAGSGAMLVVPLVQITAGFSFPRALAAGLVLLNALDLLRTDLPSLADQLDREAERNQAGHESFVNPAKSLALRLADRTPLLCGLDEAATAVAQHAAETLASFAGVVAGAAGYQEVLARTVLHRAVVRSTIGSDIFADPDDTSIGTLRVLLLALADGPIAEATVTTATKAWPGADLLAPAEQTIGGEAVRAAVLALRFEMAAVYLGLTSGMLGGSCR